MLSSFPKRRKGNPKGSRLHGDFECNAVNARVFVFVLVVL